jgi:large subunit ribosomal protein L22
MPATFRASHRHARTTARKARLVVDMIRGLPVNAALRVLDRSPRRAAVMVAKVVRSAVANAEQDEHVDPNQLLVETARVDEGPLLGGFLRWRPGARGRAMPIRKRTSHIHVVLAPRLPPAGQAAGAAADEARGQAAGGSQAKGGAKASRAKTKTKSTAKAAGKTPKGGKDD